MLLNLNHIKAVSVFASKEEADDALHYIHVQVKDERVIYTGLNPHSTARIIAPRVDAGTEELDVYMLAEFKFPAKMNIPTHNVAFDLDAHTFTIPDLSIMGQLLNSKVSYYPDADAADKVFAGFWRDAKPADRYVSIDPDDLILVRGFLFPGTTKRNAKDHHLPLPYISMIDRENRETGVKEQVPHMAGWSALDGSTYYGAIVCPYYGYDVWPLYNMLDFSIHKSGPQEMPSYWNV